MKKVIPTIVLSFLYCIAFGQTSGTRATDTKALSYFEKFIIAGIKPSGVDIETKYEDDYRAIIWNDPLIKDYKYSNEAFDKLGYEFVTETEGDNYQSSKTYRSCKKSILIQVTEWYGMKLSISMQWFSSRVKPGIGYLMYCE